MFKGLSNFAKSKNGMWFFVIIVVLFVIWALMSYSKTKGSISDNMTAGPGPIAYSSKLSSTINSEATLGGSPINTNAVQPQSQQVLSAEQLLPKDSNADFANPNGSSPNPIVVDLMAAGAFIGLDPKGSTMKNANLQLRSDPHITKLNVGPWSNSTIEPDLGQVPLDLGCN